MKRAVSLLLILGLLCGVLHGAALAAPVKSVELRYDDRLDFAGKTVEIVDAGTPVSYQVGYGIAENAVPDTAVVTLQGDTLVATGIGTAQIRIDGQLHKLSVTAAPISLLLLAGQSNMRGSDGNANRSIVCPDGMVYATFGDDRGDPEGIMNLQNARKFAASALTGPYRTVNVEGTTEHLSYYPLHTLTEAGNGTFGPDSGFAYEWVKQTGEKVWVVNAAHGGSDIATWQPNGVNFQEAVLLLQACQETLRKEIAAGHYTLSHMGYFWCQGCSDSDMTAAQYVEKYLTMHRGLKEALSFDHDSNEATDNVTLEFAGIIPILYGADSYRAGEYQDVNLWPYDQSFQQLTFNGPRVAQYWMCNNPELEDIWMVCNIGEDWVWMPDGTNGVTAYFRAHYENGTVDYPTQAPNSVNWRTPTTPKAVHETIHYKQIGYNEIGRESARNALIMLGKVPAPVAETKVELLTWDGYTPAAHVEADFIGNSATLVVPKVYPVWKSKEVTYELTGELNWQYYDLLANAGCIDGTLTSDSITQAVAVSSHNWSAWETLSQDADCQRHTCADCGKAETRTHRYRDGFCIACGREFPYAAQNAEEKFETLQAALDAYKTGTVRLLADAGSVTVSQNAVVDLNGFQIASVTGNMTVLDSKTEDYSIADNDYGKIAAIFGTVTPAEGYISISEPEGTSYHKVSLEITDMTLRTADAGICYQCIFNGDELVKARVTTCGVVLSLSDAPEIGAYGSAYSVFHQFTTGTETPSSWLQNVMKPTNTVYQNTFYAANPVYGRAYIQIGDTYIYGQTVCRSLRQQVELADGLWHTLTEAQKSEVLQMYRTFPTEMASWTIPNIKNAM